jgi:glucose-6-phosphate 1-dehydrogenase
MIAVGALVRKAGELVEGQHVELVISQQSDPAEMEAYEELLYDAVQGNSGRFARQDYVEEAWRIVDPILDNATPVYEYEPGTWGPPQASALIAPDGGGSIQRHHDNSMEFSKANTTGDGVLILD